MARIIGIKDRSDISPGENVKEAKVAGGRVERARDKLGTRSPKKGLSVTSAGKSDISLPSALESSPLIRCRVGVIIDPVDTALEVRT
jgi:hypothetical protein